jgi:outer membrane murein-binding lipoprotein Lpp
MRNFLTAAIVLGLLCSGCATARHLPTSTPEMEGVSSKSVLAFVDALDKEVDAVHSVVGAVHA